MNNYVFFVCASALALFIYFRYIHRDMMNLVDVAKTVSDRKKEKPEQETMDIMEDTLVELDMDELVKAAQKISENIDPDKNPIDEIMKMMRLDKLEDIEEDE